MKTCHVTSGVMDAPLIVIDVTKITVIDGFSFNDNEDALVQGRLEAVCE